MDPFAAKKSLGQNFLKHPGTLHKIVSAAAIQKTDEVIEIGPGHGVLTQQLIQRAAHVTAIELDDRLIPELMEKFKKAPNFILHHEDALHFTPPARAYKLVANIPYYITSPILNHFLREQPLEQRPTSLTLLVQKEVAEKIVEKPGQLSVLAIQAQLFGTPRIVGIVPPSHFKPAPTVDSAILHIECHEPLLSDEAFKKFFGMVHAGFIHRRKKLIRNLGATGLSQEDLKACFETVGLSEMARAQMLSVEQWVQLHHVIQEKLDRK